MQPFDLVIRGGTVVLEDRAVAADVGIAGERIAAVGERLGSGEAEIDAAGLLVLPGGIDSHCHIEQPEPLGVNPDTFPTATVAAACGGTTTVICFADQRDGASFTDAVANYRRKAGRAVVDYALHLLVRRLDDRLLDEELPRLIAAGNRSLKYFMSGATPLDDDEALRLMACARRNRALTVVHAENQRAIEWSTRRLLAAGLVEPRHQPRSRPMAAEREATHRAIALAEMAGAPIQIFHVSGAAPAEQIRQAQLRGQAVFGETHPHYLLLAAEDADRPGFEGAKFLCSPPLRTKADQEALWRHLAGGVIGVVSSDHSPFDFAGPDGKRAGGAAAPFTRIPNGLPAIETRLPLLFSEGVGRGRIDLATFAALSATNAAKLFGLYPKKGAIAEGADADVAIWDPERAVTIANALLHHAVDHTPFEGFRVRGWPVATISRGEVLWREGKVTAKEGRGRYLPRAPYDVVEAAAGGAD